MDDIARAFAKIHDQRAALANWARRQRSRNPART